MGLRLLVDVVLVGLIVAVGGGRGAEFGDGVGLAEGDPRVTVLLSAGGLRRVGGGAVQERGQLGDAADLERPLLASHEEIGAAAVSVVGGGGDAPQVRAAGQPARRGAVRSADPVGGLSEAAGAAVEGVGAGGGAVCGVGGELLQRRGRASLGDETVGGLDAEAAAQRGEGLLGGLVGEDGGDGAGCQGEGDADFGRAGGPPRYPTLPLSAFVTGC
ncbi:hypothetical protein [Kitasatospora aburaviensis]|uniref:Secreted protein n=1 Tax=Kitasatospora aburaviensis TaxID=67265 RepID=A0ABW1F4M6_9ACTN